MHFDQHCRESLEKFGHVYDEVHRWLDYFAGSKEYGMAHRQKRHHKEGIDEIRNLYGELAVDVAKQHIISDLKEEGWTDMDHFPDNEKDYVKMGLY